jgi:hypothetical protein
MQHMLTRLLDWLRLQSLTPEGDRAVARLTDIVIRDGSSFPITPALPGAFPGRFTTIEPAAVEVHATHSVFADEVRDVAIAPDAQAERPFFSDPARLQDRLLLAGRGYPGVDYFEAVATDGGAFIIRLTRGYDPCVRAAWVDGPRGPQARQSTGSG